MEVGMTFLAVYKIGEINVYGIPRKKPCAMTDVVPVLSVLHASAE